MDLRAIPYLLEAMKDSAMREVVEQILNAIRFYHDEKGRWDRLAAGTGLGGASAGEALVQQAREGASKAIRIAAIESLGTLGEAETLPFLVQLMGDEDEEIAAAAKAAVDKINGKVPGK
jgi:HEAT repeat protein